MKGLVNLETRNRLISKYKEIGGKIHKVGDCEFGLDIIILHNDGKGIYNFTINEIYINEYSSIYRVKKYKELPLRLKQIIEKEELEC